MIRTRSESGFSIIELMAATTVLLIVSSIVTSALLQMTQSQTTIWNRTEMHSGVRGATELLQQEVGQAGRITLPTTVTLGVAITPADVSAACEPGNPTLHAVTVGVNSSIVGANAVSGMFANAGPPSSYVVLTTLDGDAQESVRVGAMNPAATPPTITACFSKPHLLGTVLAPLGGFATGIIPPESVFPNGSSATVLKLYGDINGDGNMVYVEYTCDPVAHKLYRNMMAFNAASKPAVTDSHILLGNIIPNPGGTDCFTYQLAPPLTVQGTVFRFVLDVAITLTVQTQQVDPVTRAYQTETKALLNVSPRNVFSTWALAGMSYTDRIQSTPVSVTTLLP